MLLSAAPTRPAYMISTQNLAQTAPAVELATNGDFVVAWTGTVSQFVNNQTIVHTEPFFRRYAANGLPKDGAQVDVLPGAVADNRYDVDVAVAPGGSFIVVWTDENSGGDTDIFFQRFDVFGLPLGGPNRANTSTFDTTNQSEPAIAMADNGDFIITWTHQPASGNSDIYYRRYLADGTPLSLVDASILGSANTKSQSDVAVSPAGVTIVTWTESVGGTDNIYFKAFLPNFNVLIPATQANSTTGRNQSAPSIDVDGRGYFSIVWQDEVSASNHDILMRRYTDTGAARSPADEVVTQTAANETLPSVGMSSGQFVVAWQEFTGNQQTRYQLFSDGGTPLQTTPFTFGISFATHVADAAMNAAGEFAVVVEHPTAGDPFIQGINYRNLQDTIGLYDPLSALYLLRDSNTTGGADLAFFFTGGASNLVPLTGDWNGDGVDTVGLYNPTTSNFYLTNQANGSVAGITFGFGVPGAGWLPISGDWDNNGRDSVGLYDPVNSLFHLATDTFPAVVVLTSFGFGPPGGNWRPLAGNWNGVGGDTIGLYDGTGSTFYLRNSNTTGAADITAGFGPPSGGSIPVTGDWDNNGTDTVGLYSPSSSTFMLRNSNTIGFADVTFGFGAPFAGWLPVAARWLAGAGDTVGLYDVTGTAFYKRYANSAGFANAVEPFGPVATNWVPVVGDWTFAGKTTVGLFDPLTNNFYLRSTNTTGQFDMQVQITGATGSLPVAGDWNGDGTFSVGLYNSATQQFSLRNSNTTGAAQLTFTFQGAQSTWSPIAGDWDGDGVTNVGLYDGATSQFYLRTSNSTGGADIVAGFGAPGAGWLPVAGDWNRDGADTIGLFDPASSTFYLRNSNTSGGADIIAAYGAPGAGWKPIVGDWNGVGAASVMAPGLGASAEGQTLDDSLLAPVIAQAIAIWRDLGLPAEAVADMRATAFRISDLPGTQLAEAADHVITVDQDAAGYGWLVDATPVADPFAGDSATAGRIDLLSVVLHELGHTAGLGDLDGSASGLMSEVLSPGVRRLPGAAEIDAVLAQLN